jgi:hypothetical protein
VVELIFCAIMLRNINNLHFIECKKIPFCKTYWCNGISLTLSCYRPDAKNYPMGIKCFSKLKCLCMLLVECHVSSQFLPDFCELLLLRMQVGALSFCCDCSITVKQMAA